MDWVSWIDSHCMTARGTLNSRVTRREWWERNGSLNIKIELEREYPFPPIGRALYHAYHDLREVPKCPSCQREVTFRRFKDGYWEHCSLACSYQSKDRSAKISRAAKGDLLRHEKARVTNQEKYGIAVLMDDDEFQVKLRDAKLEKYGTLHAGETKRRSTNLERYGAEEPLTLPSRQKFMHDKKMEMIERDGWTNYIGAESNQERELASFVQSIDPSFRKDRLLLGGRELDLYSPERKMAIEFCGIYWHSERFQDKNSHYKKFLDCREQGVRLITIFEDEWLHRGSQVRSFISGSLGRFTRRLGARTTDTTILSANNPAIPTFMDKYHIQGRPSNVICGVGLFHDQEMIGLLTLSRHHRHLKDSPLVLSRMAFMDSVQIIGGASKLISMAHSISNGTLITWSDNRWSTGQVYRTAGFRLDKHLPPDYSYYVPDNTQTRKSKQWGRKSNHNIPPETTEREYFINKNIYRIWDCGKIRWVLEKQ